MVQGRKSAREGEIDKIDESLPLRREVRDALLALRSQEEMSPNELRWRLERFKQRRRYAMPILLEWLADPDEVTSLFAFYGVEVLGRGEDLTKLARLAGRDDLKPE